MRGRREIRNPHHGHIHRSHTHVERAIPCEWRRIRVTKVWKISTHILHVAHRVRIGMSIARPLFLCSNLQIRNSLSILFHTCTTTTLTCFGITRAWVQGLILGKNLLSLPIQHTELLQTTSKVVRVNPYKTKDSWF
jgi:hypothetical protein